MTEPGPEEQGPAPFAPRPLLIGPAQILVLLGAVAVTASMFLHWYDLSVSLRGVQRNVVANADEVPVAFLFDYKTNSTDPSLLIVLVPIVALALVDVLLLRHRIVTFVAATATLATVGLYAYQLDRATDRISAGLGHVINPGLTDLLGLGVYVGVVGGVLLLVGAVLMKPAAPFGARPHGP
jgi:hypothetical protein